MEDFDIVSLSDEQTEVYKAYSEGKNVFLTGPGGSGKSFLIRHIIEDCKKRGIRYAVCATTGCAALLLGNGSKTLHSWAGIGLAKGSEESIVTKIMLNKFKSKPWKSTDLLILDEVSMLSKQLFDLLDHIGKRVRKNDKPFGGIQLVFSGDFYQLPPVGTADNPDSSSFCFESDHWKETFDFQIELKKVFRQKDPRWIKILRQIRQGKISRRTIETLHERVQHWTPIIEEMDVKPVSLMPTRNQVELINQRKMSKLTTPIHKYEYKFVYEVPSADPSSNKKVKVATKDQMEKEKNMLLKNSLFDDCLELKVGAQVMCIANLDMDAGLCNGSTGIVKEMVPGYVTVKFDGIEEERKIEYHAWHSETYPGMAIKQIPLILAWAVTIHKSQGATLAKARMNLGTNVFACGQTYVALSRVKDLNGLYLDDFNYTKIKVSQKVKNFYELM